MCTMSTKRWWWLAGLVLVCGLGARLSAQPVGVEDKIAIFKGALSYTTNYVVDNSKADLNVALGLERVTATKPKMYFYLVCTYSYDPTYTESNGTFKLTGDGFLDLWPVGLVIYGDGRHQANRTWNSATKYAYDATFYGVDLLFPAWLKKGYRVGTGWVDGAYAVSDTLEYADYFTGDGLAYLNFKVKKFKNTAANPPEWYDLSSGALELSGMMMRDMYVLTDTKGVDPKASLVWGNLGIGKIKFKMDTKLSAAASALGLEDGLDWLSGQVDTLLQQGGYPTVDADFTPEPAP